MTRLRDRVEIDIAEGCALVSLQRPDKRNALDLPLFEAIVDAQRRLRRERGLRAVVLSGAGEDFCSGLDVKALFNDRSGMRRLLFKWWPGRPNLAQQVCVGWRKLPVPVFAAIQGRCWGGGLQIALGADFRIAHPQASLSVMEGRWGLIPDMGGTLALRDNLPCDRAMRLAMSAEEFSGEQALAWNVVTELSDRPAERAAVLAGELMQRSPDALAAVKQIYLKSWSGGDGRVLAAETWGQLRVLRGPNQRIAVRRQQGEEIPFRDL